VCVCAPARARVLARVCTRAHVRARACVRPSYVFINYVCLLGCRILYIFALLFGSGDGLSLHERMIAEADTWCIVVCCSKKVLLLKNLQSYDKMATYRVAGWFGLLCRSIDSSTLIAYPSPFMRQSVAFPLSSVQFRRF